MVPPGHRRIFTLQNICVNDPAPFTPPCPANTPAVAFVCPVTNTRDGPSEIRGDASGMSFYDTWSAVMISVIVGFVLVFTAIVGAKVLAPYAQERAKGVSYECGMLPIGRNWAQVHVRYYLIAILFLIFDVEAVFIFPWAVTFLDLPEYVFWEMIVFIAVLVLGLAYAWRRGVLEWK